MKTNWFRRARLKTSPEGFTIVKGELRDLFLVADKLGYHDVKAKMEGRIEQTLFIHSCNEVALAFNNLEKLRRLFDLDDQEEQTLLISALTHDAGKKSPEFSSYLDVVREFRPKFSFLTVPRVEHVVEQIIEDDVRQAVKLMDYDDSTIGAAISCCLLHHRKSGAETRISALMKEYHNIRVGLLSDLLTYIDHVCSIMHFHEMREFISSSDVARVKFMRDYLHLEECSEDPDIIFPDKRLGTLHYVRLEVGRRDKSSPPSMEKKIEIMSPPYPISDSLWRFLLKEMKDKIQTQSVDETVGYSGEFKEILRRTISYYNDLFLKSGYDSDPELCGILTCMCEKASAGSYTSLHDAFQSFERNYREPSFDFESNWSILTRREMPSISPYDLTEKNNFLGFLNEATNIIGRGRLNGES